MLLPLAITPHTVPGAQISGSPCVLLKIHPLGAETLHITKPSPRVPASPWLYIDGKPSRYTTLLQNSVLFRQAEKCSL